MTFWDGTCWVPDRTASPPPRLQRATRLLAGLAEAGLITLLTFGLIASAAFAAKPASSVWVVELMQTGALDSSRSLQLGDHFTVGYQTRDREPWALAACYPNETSEYVSTDADGSIWSEVFSLWAGGPTPQNFVLGDSVYPLWTAGGADCTVSLIKYSPDLSRQTLLAIWSFIVVP